MTCVTWTYERTSTLVNLYRKHECLWNIHLVDYKKRTKRQEALEDLARQCDTTVEEVKKKINTLRCQFLNEHSKYEMSLQQNEAGRSEVIYTPKWVYYNDLSFLKTVSNSRRFSSSLRNLQRIGLEEVFQMCQPILKEGGSAIVPYSPLHIKEDTDRYDGSGSPEGCDYDDFPISYEDQRFIKRMKYNDYAVSANGRRRHSTNDSAPDSPPEHGNEEAKYDMTYHDQDSTGDQRSLSPRLNRVKQELSEIMRPLNLQYEEQPNSKRSSMEPAHRAFGDYIAFELSEIRDEYSIRLAKLKIHNIIFEAQSGMYERVLDGGSDDPEVNGTVNGFSSS